MANFYGGQAGKSFSISKIFNNCAELIEDISLGAASSIGLEEFVVISYGSISQTYPIYYVDNGYDGYWIYFIDGTKYLYYILKNGNEIIKEWSIAPNLKVHENEGDRISIYNLNVAQDQTILKEAYSNFNSCFFQKNYNTSSLYWLNQDIKLTNSGWGYKFISQLTGNTPVFNNETTVALSEDIKIPQINIDSVSNGNIDNPQVQIILPKPTTSVQQQPNILMPQVELKKQEGTNNLDGLSFDFIFPTPLVNSEITTLNSLEKPQVVLNLKNGLEFNFSLPKGVELHPYSLDNNPVEKIKGDWYLNTDTGILEYVNNEGISEQHYNFQSSIIVKNISYAENNEVNKINVDVVPKENENGLDLQFILPNMPNFNIAEVNTIENYQEANVEAILTNQGYDLKFFIPKGAAGNSLVIWDGHKPLELSGNKTELQEIKNAIQTYLNENMADNTPKTSGELLPITYIFAVQAPAEIGENDEGEDLTSQGIETYTLEDTDEIATSIEAVSEVSGENIYYISEKTILGFFGYYTDKWNIFLAPNGGGAGNIGWEIL